MTVTRTSGAGLPGPMACLGRVSSALALGVACAALAACASGDHPPPGELDGWQRTETWRHNDVIEFDNVATTTSLDTVAWFTRGSPAANGNLAYWEKRDGKGETEIAIAVPSQPYLIPVAVGADGTGWIAVAASRDAPRGANTGLRAWTGTTRDEGKVVTDGELELPAPAPPASMSAARMGGISVVAASVEGEPAVWRRADGDESWTLAGRQVLDWPRDLGIVNLRVTSDDERFVLAAVDENGDAHLLASEDGAAWDTLEPSGLPRGVGAVATATCLEQGRMALGWYDKEDSVPFNATAATIQILEGDELLDQGRIAADGDSDDQIERIYLAGAGSSTDDRLLVVGAALRSNGTTTPMVWAREDDDWRPSEQPELVGRLDYRFRGLARTADGALVGLATGTRHVDVEAWRWEPDDD